MTFPFENDTSRVIKKISDRSIRSNKYRNMFTIITIALASALLTTILLLGFGTRQEDINLVKDTAQIVYRGLPEQQGNDLYLQDEIEWVGETFTGTSERIQDTTVDFIYGNAEMLASQQIRFVGEIPQEENEIMLSKSLLKNMGYGYDLGQKIYLSFQNRAGQEFILTGIWSSDYEVKDRYIAFVSKEYFNMLAGYALPMDYYISLKDASWMSEEEAAEYAFSLAKKLDISSEQVVVRSNYFIQLNNTEMDIEMLFYVLVGMLTLLGAGIVIYSIFYISVAENIRKYGQLRTLGTTKKQIKRIVYRKGKLLAAIGIPFGLLIGNIIGYFLLPNGWNWITSVFISIVTGMFTLLIVMISIRTPVKKAANVSPSEALRYSAYQGKEKVTRKLHRKISPFSLARMNLSRNKVKSILTIFSLAIGGVLLITLSSVLLSHNSEAEVRGDTFPVGEFHIKLKSNQSWDTATVSLTGLQKLSLFNDDFVAQIKEIDGVEGIKHWYYTEAEYFVNGDSGSWIQGFSREEQQNLEKNLLAGTTDYDELVENNGIILLENSREKVYKIAAAIGDTVEVEYETKDGSIVTKNYTIMGVVSGYNYVGFIKCFTIPEQLMYEATGIDYTGTIAIITDADKYESVELNLRQLVSGKSEFGVETFKEELNSLNSVYDFTFEVMLMVAIIIACFSLINLANTTITNFLSRRQEFGMLQSIGLTQKQLKKMLLYEGLIYSLSAALVTVIIGTGVGILAVNALKVVNPYFFFVFPWSVVMAYLSAILIVQSILFVFSIRTLKKQSLVERIKL